MYSSYLKEVLLYYNPNKVQRMEKEISVFFKMDRYYFCMDGYQVKFSEIINLLEDDTLLSLNDKCTFDNPLYVFKVSTKDNGNDGDSAPFSIELKLVKYNLNGIKLNTTTTINVLKQDDSNNYTYSVGNQKNIACEDILLILIEKVLEIIMNYEVTEMQEKEKIKPSPSLK